VRVCVCVRVCVQEIPPRGKDASSARFDIVMNITKGLRGRPKTYTFTLSIPLVSTATAEDKVISAVDPLCNIATPLLKLVDVRMQ